MLIAAGLYSLLTKTDIAGIGNGHTTGKVIDGLDGVYVYYNGGVGQTHGRNTAPNGYNIGVKYQCVEFVKRYYFEHLHHEMPDPWGNAKDFFDPSVADGEQNTRRGLTQFTNGSAVRPQKGDLLVMKPTITNPYGHVAIVAEASEIYVEIIQQNPGPNAPTRIRTAIHHIDEKWYIAEERILGWLRKTNE